MKNVNNNFEVERPSSLQRGWIILLVLLLTAVLTLRVVFPSRVTPADAAVDLFSGERAMVHLPIIASQPHPQGSPAQATVRDYLVGQLTDLGLDVEVQKTSGAENVVAQLPGSDPTGTIVILSHYDSPIKSPGAGDNGSGVAVLLEIMRALANGPIPHNNIIALFDDGEELPGEFTGSRAFVKKSPLISDVRVAISLDTAADGPISINEVGPDNGWLIAVLARSYAGGAWTSMSGGGNYDSTPFRDAGIQVIAIESNYPFWQKHTPHDLPAIVNPASVQQMGEQTLAITRELGISDLTNTHSKQETFFAIPLLGFVHYPESLAVVFAIIAGILLIIALVLAIRNHLATFKGLSISLGTILVIAALCAVGVGIIWPRFPALFGWEINQWPDWPEVIPPYGGWIDLVLALIIFGLSTIGYLKARRWSTRVDFVLAGLFPILLVAVATAFAVPRGNYLFTWPVLISSLALTAGVFALKKGVSWAVDVSLTLAAITMVVFILPFLPGIVMADGMKSLAILAGVEVIILGVIFPAIDRLLVRQPALETHAQ